MTNNNKNIEWYNDYIDINGYTEDNLPEFLFLVFPYKLSKRDCRMITKENEKLGYNTTKFYKKQTIMVSNNNDNKKMN